MTLGKIKGGINFMFNEERLNKGTYSDVMGISEPASSESYNLQRHWEVIDTLTDMTTGEKTEYRYFNTVVNSCSNLIACLLKGQSGYAGLQYWAVGSGNPSMSNTSPDTPSVTDTKLLAETFRKAIAPTDIAFLDTNNVVTASVTNKIQVSVTFTESEANGELREFGLYGGNATATKDSGIMINRKIHPLIYKTSGMRLDRVIRITL
jgi:hypothetical protein